MRIPTLVALPFAALLATACATRSTTSTSVSGTPVVAPVPVPVPAPSAAVVNPAGRWSISLVAQGQEMDLVMDLSRISDGNYGGFFTSQLFPPMDISMATLIGNKLVISVLVPTGDMATMTLTFTGDVVEGDWSMPDDGSKLSGKRIERHPRPA